MSSVNVGNSPVCSATVVKGMLKCVYFYSDMNQLLFELKKIKKFKFKKKSLKKVGKRVFLYFSG